MAAAVENIPASCLQPPSSSHMNAVSLRAYSDSCSPDEGHSHMIPSVIPHCQFGLLKMACGDDDAELTGRP